MKSPRATPPQAASVLALCAHPDDESFGLGAVLACFAEQGARVRVICFTHGEASTLGNADRPLGEVRAGELRAAAGVLGVEHVELLDHPDGRLAGVPPEELWIPIETALRELQELQELRELQAPHGGSATSGASDNPVLVLVFDEGGITGHPDHVRATQAALETAGDHGVPVLAWALPVDVAERLNVEFGSAFVGRGAGELDFAIDVDRRRQRDAIACHGSQSGDNPVLWRRLELLGDREHLRWLRRPKPRAGS